MKIKKTAIQDPSARNAIQQCAQMLDQYADDPSVAGLASKLRASIEGPVDSSSDQPSNLEKALGEMRELQKAELHPETAEAVRKASADLQLQYLHQVSPQAAAVYEQRRRVEAAQEAARFGRAA